MKIKIKNKKALLLSKLAWHKMYFREGGEGVLLRLENEGTGLQVFFFLFHVKYFFHIFI